MRNTTTTPQREACRSPDNSADPEANRYAKQQVLGPDWNGVVPSSALLGLRQTIEIEHNGQRYRLQCTKSGKLILTK